MNIHDIDNDEPVQDVNKLIEGIKGLKARPKQERDQRFKQLLPAILEAQEREVSQKDLLEFLKKNGVKLSPNTFRTKIEAAKLELQQVNLASGPLKSA
jgi:hypothetical protein